MLPRAGYIARWVERTMQQPCFELRAFDFGDLTALDFQPKRDQHGRAFFVLRRRVYAKAGKALASPARKNGYQ